MNVLLIVVDAFDQTRLEETGEELIPAITSFSKRGGYRFLNVYSQSPYTEAAVMSLYAGQNTLDNGGYLMRFNNCEKTIFECFHDAGYETFFNAHAPQVFPTSQRRGIDNIFYSRPFDFDVLWRYRLDYYSKLLNKNEFDDDDLKKVNTFLEDNFKEAKQFLFSLMHDTSECDLIKKYDCSFDALDSLKKLQKELLEYEKNKDEYCFNVLKEGRNHQFFKIPHFSVGNYSLSEELYKYHNSEIKKLCKKIGRKNVFRCLTRNEDLYKSFFDTCVSFFKPHKKNEILKRFYMIKNAVFMTHLHERYGTQSLYLKEQPSFNSFSNHFFDWLNKRKKEQPFFACLHVDDIHFPEVFYSYDSNDLGLIKKEIELANSYFKKNLKGKSTILHDISLSFADYHVGLIMNRLEEIELLKDTLVIVTADHGFSYSGYPIRRKDINTFYLENFKIPLYVFESGLKNEKNVTNLLSSVDIPTIICNIAGIKPPLSFVGIDGRKEGRDLVCIEYCGGGCPDLKRREIMLAAFDMKKMVCFQTTLNDSFSWDKAVGAYDLEHDPKQKKNIIKRINKTEYQKYYELARERFCSIKMMTEK